MGSDHLLAGTLKRRPVNQRMGFDQFLGNPRIVTALRSMLRGGRVPNAILFTGPRGSGKFTLARMFAQAANCERLADDFCGECKTCARIALLADPWPLIEQGLAQRGESADSAMVERMPLLVEPHPDVWGIFPDPVRLRNPVAHPMIRVGQLRAIQRAAYFTPEAKRRVFILDGADSMRRTDADIFLKVLEEPPDTATLILTATRVDSLRPTIRSRCLQFHFAPVEADQIEALLEQQTALKPQQRKLAARLAGGSPGLALELDLEESGRLRREALRLIELSIGAERYRELFAATALLSKQEKESFENVLDLFYSLFTDLLELAYNSKSTALRNPDLRGELLALSKKIDLKWITQAAADLDRLESRLRRNVGRQLGLDAAAVSWGLH